MGENEFVNSDTYKEYEWKGMPLTFSSNSIGSEPEFISDLPEKSLIGTHIYVGKIIHFGTFERTRNWGEEIIVEYIKWWENEGEHNFHKYERYHEELFQNEVHLKI